MEISLIIKNWLLLNKSSSFIKNKYTSTFVLVYLFYCTSFSQNNLVPNGSFEIYNTCPTISGGGEIDKAIPWFQPNYPYAGAGGSSDYFNFCSGLTCNAIFQCPKTGIGMAGIAFFFDSAYYNIDNWREYIEVGLTTSLIKGKRYCIRYYANKANNSGMSGFPIKQLQAVLTNDSLLYNSPNYSYIPSVTTIMEANSIISDTVNWIPIETTYTSKGGEKFLTIGDFSPGNLINYLVIGNPNAPNNTLGYYLIDDVSIYEQPEVNAGNDTLIPPGDSVQLGVTGRPDVFYNWQPTIGLSNPNVSNPMATPPEGTTYILTVTDTNALACTNVFKDTVIVQVGYIGINESKSQINFNLYPNPTSTNLFIECNTQNSEFIISDILGKEMKKIKTENKKTTIDISDLENGIYFIGTKNSIRKFIVLK